MTNLNYELIHKLEKKIEASSSFQYLWDSWDILVNGAHFKTCRAEAFSFLSLSNSDQDGEVVEDDGNLHIHLGYLHLGVSLTQERNIYKADYKTLKALAEVFATKYTVEITELVKRCEAARTQVVQVSEEAKAVQDEIYKAQQVVVGLKAKLDALV